LRGCECRNRFPSGMTKEEPGPTDAVAGTRADFLRERQRVCRRRGKGRGEENLRIMAAFLSAAGLFWHTGCL
jgi:hypothetical protein